MSNNWLLTIIQYIQQGHVQSENVLSSFATVSWLNDFSPNGVQRFCNRLFCSGFV